MTLLFLFTVVGPHTVTTNISEFRKIIRNTQVDGGGDCPEKSLTAIKESLEISLPKSFIFVFTDANPKDTYWLQEVIKLIREKSSRVILEIINIFKYFLLFLIFIPSPHITWIFNESLKNHIRLT